MTNADILVNSPKNHHLRKSPSLFLVAERPQKSPNRGNVTQSGNTVCISKKMFVGKMQLKIINFKDANFMNKISD